MQEITAIIRKELRKRGFTGSVTQGRGTACAWIHVRGSGEWGAFTDKEREILKAAGEIPGGNFCPIAPESQALLLARLEGRAPDPKDVQHAKAMSECRMWD